MRYVVMSVLFAPPRALIPNKVYTTTTRALRNVIHFAVYINKSNFITSNLELPSQKQIIHYLLSQCCSDVGAKRP